MSNCFQSQAEHYWVYLKWHRKENFGRLVRQSQGVRTNCSNGNNSKQHFFYTISLSSSSFLPIPEVKIMFLLV